MAEPKKRSLSEYSPEELKEMKKNLADTKATTNVPEKENETNEIKKETKAIVSEAPAKETTPAPLDTMTQKVLEQLMDEVANLKKQLSKSPDQDNSPRYDTRGKLKFDIPRDEDVQEETVTFTARNVMYIVASYIDDRGIEKIPPFKLITFTYQASDIKKNGNEESIVNYCQYTTQLKREIEFLRSHPFYGVQFSENLNSMMNEAPEDFEFKARAALQINQLPPESVIQHARLRNIPNANKMNVASLKRILIDKEVEEYKKDAKKLQDDRAKRMILRLSANEAE
jgi:hypothetical protein